MQLRELVYNLQYFVIVHFYIFSFFRILDTIKERNKIYIMQCVADVAEVSNFEVATVLNIERRQEILYI